MTWIDHSQAAADVMEQKYGTLTQIFYPAGAFVAFYAIGAADE